MWFEWELRVEDPVSRTVVIKLYPVYDSPRALVTTNSKLFLHSPGLVSLEWDLQIYKPNRFLFDTEVGSLGIDSEIVWKAEFLVLIQM